MRAKLARYSFVTAALLLAFAVLAESRHAPPSARDDAVAAEIERIRAHLARVEAELQSADVSQLSAAQRALRSWNIATLRRYREAGGFPHSHLADPRVPVFVDEHGTLSALGYLIARSGRMDLVRRIARACNHATVTELADDAELAAWLRGAGLSVVEAARIQPASANFRAPYHAAVAVPPAGG